MLYDHMQEFVTRLRNSVVLYDGSPFYVSDIVDEARPKEPRRKRGEDERDFLRRYERWTGEFDQWRNGQQNNFDRETHSRLVLTLTHTIHGKRLSDIKFSDPKLKYNTFNLGYANIGPCAVYVSRLPTRGGGYQQGLNTNNLRIVDNPQTARRINTGMLIGSEGFENMLRGTYPTYDEAQTMLRENRQQESVAFDRVLSLGRDSQLSGLHYLFYRGTKIGYGEVDRVVIPREYRYVKEILDEKGVRCNYG